MKRLFAACGAALFTLALATPAFAHHVTEDSLSAEAVCSEAYETIVSYSAELDGSFDATWTVEYNGNEVDSGSSDAPPNVRSISGSFEVTTSGTLVLYVQFIGEDAEAPESVEVEIDECQAPPTTTTTVVPTTTTTAPPTTSTSTTSTTEASPVTTTAPSTPAPPTLAHTGSGTLAFALSGLAALGLGSWLIRRNRTA